jgi:hypothetical protein
MYQQEENGFLSTEERKEVGISVDQQDFSDSSAPESSHGEVQKDRRMNLNVTFTY